MKNDYEVNGTETIIFLKRRDGIYLKTLIDTRDLPKVQEFNTSWFAHWSQSNHSFYVTGNFHLGKGVHKTIPLHRFIMDAPKGLVVDHINHDTLDNRRSNLRIVTIAENSQNRRGAFSSNKSSGIRGVSWHKRKRKWMAHMRLKGKCIFLGYFNDIRDAEIACIKARSEKMPYSVESI